MKKIHNIFIKMFLLLALAIGWGSSAWADRLTPAFDGTYYYIKFANISRYMYNGSSADVELSVANPAVFSDENAQWQLVGDASSFQLVNANGQYLKLTGTRGSNGCYQLAAGSDGAANFTLDEWSTTAEYWELKNIDRNIFVNPRPNNGDNFVSHYSDNDNNNKVEFVPVQEPLLKASPAPAGGSWGDGTQWYKIHNVRAMSERSTGYLATDGDYADSEGNLRLNASDEPATDGGLWCLVITPNGSVNFYNKGKGTEYVLGTSSDSKTKPYAGTADEDGVTKTYNMGASGDGFWICLTGGNKHWEDSRAEYLSIWDNGGDTKTNTGNRFIFTEVITTTPVTPTFTPAEGTVTSLASVTVDFDEGVYNVADAHTFAAPIADDAPQPMPVLRRISDNAVVATATSVTSAATLGFGEPYVITFDTFISDGEYTLRIPDGAFYVVDGEFNWTPAQGVAVNYTLENPAASEGYRVIINGDNGYTVSTTAAVKSGIQSAVNGGYLDLATAPDLKDLRSLSIDCTDKFVWGPVVDNSAKTITYTVKEPVSEVAGLSEGFYQLEIVEASQDANFKTRLANIIKTTTVNVKSNNYYVMPWYDNASYLQSNQVYKYSGVYTNGYAPVSYVYLKRDGSGNLHFQSINGHYSTRPDQAGRDDSSIASANYKIENSKLSVKGWVKQGYWNDNGSSGDEGPHEAYGNSNTFYEFYYAAKADISAYNVYKVDFGNWTQGSSVKADPNVTYTGSAICYGLPTVYRNGYFFFPKDYAPVVGDFSFSGVSYTEPIVRISDADANGIRTLTFMEKPTDWTVHVNGGYKVSYLGGEAKGDGETLEADATVAATDFTVNCTDQFVWGPVIDDVNKTVTFEVRDVATSLSAGRWYQIQLLDRRGKYNGNNWTDNFYETLNSQNTIAKKSSTLYVMNYPSLTMNTYPTEISGMPVPERDVYWSYVYLADVDASNNIAWQRPNGNYVKSTGENNGATLARNWALTANGDNSFSWNRGIVPWNNLGDDGYKHLALGYTSSGVQDATFQTYFHAVKSDEDYAIYKVVLSDGDVATYTGSANVFVADGGKLEFTEKTINNGNYIFLPKGTTPVLSDFTFTSSKVHTLNIDTSSDIWTLSLRENLPVLGSNVELRFVDAAGNVLKGASVAYTRAGSGAVTLSAANSPYDFQDADFVASHFSADGSNFTYVSVTYDEEHSVLTFLLSPHVLPTGVYRMVASKDDRGFFVDSENYIGVGKNRHKTGWAAPTEANSLWYVCKGSGNKYYISSLSYYPSRGAGHVAFLKGTGDGTSFVLDTPSTWFVDYLSTGSRYSTNQSGYDTTVPTPDYFSVKLSDSKLLTSTPGYDGAGACRLVAYEAGASDIEFQSYAESLITDPNQQALLALTKALWATEPLDGEVNLRFVDENDAPTMVSAVTYHPSDGSADVVIPADATSYTFNDEQYADYLAGDLFTVNESGYSLHTSYDAGTKTLTFIVFRDANELLYSSAPQNGQWADDTKWFTFRSTQSTGFMNTAEGYIDGSRNLKIDNTNDPVAAHERGGAWCAVKLNFLSCQIYNAAYGPDFVLGVSGTDSNARLQMYPKDNVPAGVSTVFMIGENDNCLSGASHAYSIGTTGYLYSQNGYVVLNGGYGDDLNSSFTFTRIPNSVINSWPEYDVYKVEHHNAICTYDITYIDASQTHGKRNTADNGDFLILNHGSGTDVSDFNVATNAEFDIESISTADAAGHYYKRLIFEVNDLLATEVYTIIVVDKTKNQDFDLSTVGIEYINRPHHNGDTFKTRPGVAPASIGFLVEDNAQLHDKFIWGPVINTEAQTVTFDIRSLAEELTEGWYMFQVENASDVATINSRINYYPGNYNEASNLQYLMESRFGKCKMKFTGVGGYDDRYAYMHVSKDGQYITLRGDNQASEFTGLAYTFADGRLTLTGCSVDGTTLEPIEMPALRAASSGITFRATPISLDQWEVYRINFDFGGADVPSPLSAVYAVNEATGSKKEIHHGDFIILPHNSSVAATTVSRYTFNKDADGTPVASVTNEGIKVSVDGDHDGATNVLTFHLAASQKKYVVFIKAGEGLSDSEKAEVADYKAVVRSTGAEFATTVFDAEKHIYSANIYLPITTTVDATTFKVDNESQFVWGPVVDENTYTFEIRKAATSVESGKWYQIQLKDEEIPSLIGSDKRPRNIVDMVNSQSVLPVYVRNRGSYIYAVSSRVSDRNYPLELTGMLPEANEKLNYVYVDSDGKIYSQNGSYVDTKGTNSGTALTFSSISDANNYFAWSSIGAVSNSSSAPYITLGWWSGIAGDRPLHLHFHESPVADTYDVYQLHFAAESLVQKADYIGTDAVQGQTLNNLVENAFLFLNKGAWEITTSPSNQRKAPITKTELEAKLAKEFKALGYKTITVIVGNKAADGITPITLDVSDEITGMILHRQHAVYDNYNATAVSERPTDGAGYIHGSGWTTNPNTGTAIQRASTYKVTQYIKQGQDTKCYLPAVSRTGGGIYLGNYQRFYDYETEEAPDASVVKDFSPAAKYTGKTTYSNGWRTDGVEFFTANLNGASQQIIGLDCSDFTDKGDVGTNYKEPSLAIRVIYTIKDAKIMADDLYQNCRNAVNPDHYYQTSSFIVPNVMRGSADHYDGASLLSLDMPWSNYWAYNTAIDVATASDDIKDAALQRLIDENANVAAMIPNVSVSVSPNLDEYVEAGVFYDQGGLPGGDNTKYVFANGNHFVAYQLKKEVPDGMKGAVMVQFTAGSITYNIAKFDLEFQANTEPLAITSVVGTKSRRWTENLIGPDKEGYEEVAKLTFGQKKKNFKSPNNSSNESDFTYAFPLDFDKTSYAYGSDNKYSMYRVTTRGYGYLYYPVSVYENNILNRANSVTSIDDDYFLYIDAAEQPGTVTSIPFDGNLCAGSKLYFSGYVGSSNDGAKSSSGGVIFRLVGIDSGAGRHTLVSYLPGMFSNWAYDTEGNAYNAMVGASVPIKMSYDVTAQNPQFYTTSGTRTGDANKTMIWQQVGFVFMLDAGSAYPKYELEVVNNCYSTKGGDYVLDDFRVCASIPQASVDFSTPLCEDRVRHIKVHTLYNDLVKATGKSRVNSQAEYDALPETEKTMGVSYCFIDEEMFNDKLNELNPDPALLTSADYNTAFEYALVGDFTFDRSNPNHAFHNFDVSRYFAGVPAYSFKDSEDDNIYRETKNGADYIIFKESVSHNAVDAAPVNWVVGRKYLILYSIAKVTEAHLTAHSVGTAVYQVNGSCYSCKEFTIRPSVSARSDIEYLDFDAMQACSGQTATFTVDMVASKPSGDVVERGLYYDYWIGDAGVNDGAGHYTIARNGSKADLETKVLTEAFVGQALAAAGIIHAGDPLPSGCSVTTESDGQHWHESYTFTESINSNGTVNDLSGAPITKTIDFLITDILRDFRAAFPSATAEDFDLVVGAALAADQSYMFTPSMKAFVKALITPDPTTGRTPLVLRRQSFDLDLNINNTVALAGPPAKRFIYFTAVPIVPQWGTYGTEDVMYCPAPKEFSINLHGEAPSVEDGFAGFPYPADMHNVPIRLGLHQVEATRLTSAEETNDALAANRSELIVPLRNITAIYGKNNTIEANRLGGQMISHDRYITGSSMPYVFLTHTDDPYYTVRIDELIQNSADNDLSLFPVGRVVSIVDDNYRKTAGVDGHIDGMGELHMVFSSDFAPREGYTYTLKVDFLEQTNLGSGQSLPVDYVEPCPGSFIFDMKIVPEYQQWTAAAGNPDWTNDANWARADRDVLHADNAASDGTYPMASYLNNATNYHGDAHFSASDRTSAHGFIPMYFTHVLMHDEDIQAPDLYKLTKPEKSGGQFLAGLQSTASEMAKYDMLVTPVDAGGNALALANRYAAHTGNYGCELFWTNICDGLTFEPGTMMYDAQHLQYNRVWVEYELETNRWYTLASPLKGTYAGEWYSPEDGGRQLTPHFYPVTYNPALNDRFNPAYYQRSWDKAGEAWIYRMAGDDGTYIGFEHQTFDDAGNRVAANVRVQKPVYLNWSYVYNDVAVDYSNGGFSVNAHYTDTDSDGHLLNATGGKVLVRMPKDDLSYDYYQSEAAAHYDETHPAGGNEQNPDPTQPGTVPGRDDYGNGDNDAGNNPDGSNADGSGNASGRNNANGSNEYTPQQGNQSYNGDNTTLPGRTSDTHPRLMSDDLNLSGSTIAQSIQNASATNPYYLVGNPFMAPMNMDKFFAQQTCTHDGQAASTFEAGKYWILNGNQQDANIKVDGQWVSTSAANAGVVAPLQGFFVQLPTNSAGQLLHPDADATGARGVQLSFDKDVQQPMTVIGEDSNGKPIFGYDKNNGQGQAIYNEKPSLKSRRRSAELEQPTMFRITATNGSQLESTAVVYFHDKASAHYDAREDAETLLDGNIASKVSTVFTSAPSTDSEQAASGQDQQALQINTMPAGVTVIPVGVIAPKDDTRTTLCFTGIDALEAAMAETPHLYDAAEGTLHVLDEGTTVSVTGTTAGRYFIVSGTTLPVIDDNDDDNDDYDGRIYDLRGIRVNSVQHGTVTISRSRKEYNK